MRACMAHGTYIYMHAGSISTDLDFPSRNIAGARAREREREREREHKTLLAAPRRKQLNEILTNKQKCCPFFRSVSFSSNAKRTLRIPKVTHMSTGKVRHQRRRRHCLAPVHPFFSSFFCRQPTSSCSFPTVRICALHHAAQKQARSVSRVHRVTGGSQWATASTHPPTLAYP